MRDASTHDDANNKYVIDPEHTAEMVRLLDQDHLITANMGWWFPPHVEPATLHSVLDLACGPGGWVQEVAFASPHLHVTGVDISELMITYARMQAQVQYLDNAHFQVMDICRCHLVENKQFLSFNYSRTERPIFGGWC